MTELLGKIAPDDYARPLQLFNGSTIGQHFRHIVDFYGCLVRGIDEGRIDYANRERDTRIETEPLYAADVLTGLAAKCATVAEGDQLEIVADFSSDLNETRPVVVSTVGRELMYAYDHAVHHLAMIKMGLKAACPDVKVDHQVGVAPSTLKHWQEAKAEH